MSDHKYSDKDLHRMLGVYVEQIDSKVQLVLEVVVDMQRKIANLPTRDEFNELKTEVRIFKHALTATNKDVQHHERPITKLEARRA